MTPPRASVGGDQKSQVRCDPDYPYGVVIRRLFRSGGKEVRTAEYGNGSPLYRYHTYGIQQAPP